MCSPTPYDVITGCNQLRYMCQSSRISLTLQLCPPSVQVCVFSYLLAFFILLLWLPGKEMEQKGKGFSTSPLRWTICLGLLPLVAWYGVRRKSLDHSGGTAAIVVGFVRTVASGCFCESLLVFFFTSSRLTQWRGRKKKFEEDHKKGVELRSVYHCMQMCTVLAD